MSDNVKDLPIEPTELEKKQKAFEENPDDFININDIVLAVRRKDGDILETLVNPLTRVELEVGLMRVTHQAFGIFNAMSYAQQKANEPKIQQPGGILNFARSRFKK